MFLFCTIAHALEGYVILSRLIFCADLSHPYSSSTPVEGDTSPFEQELHTIQKEGTRCLHKKREGERHRQRERERESERDTKER